MIPVTRMPVAGSSLSRITSNVITQKRNRRRVADLGPYNIVHHFYKTGALDLQTVEKIAAAFEHAEYSPRLIKNLPPAGPKLTETSKRFGLVGVKLGMMPQWTVKGQRVLCTAIHIPDNQVVSVIDPDTWYKTSYIGKRKAYGRFGPMYNVTVGAQNIPEHMLGKKSVELFKKWGIHPKEYLGNFLTTEDALVQPGTHLDARHFNIGQYVNVSGRTVDWGFQGAMHRWGFRGMPERRTTKSHRRVGSIGSTGDARVWPGKRLPGHMGYEWRQITGLEVVRINPKENVIYVKGSIPGDNEYPVLLNDCVHDEKKVLDAPFPTFMETIQEVDEEEAVLTQDLNNLTINKDASDVKDDAADIYGYNRIKTTIGNITSKDIYSPKLFNFNSSSVVFSEVDEKKSASRDKMRAKIAKIKK